MCTIEDLIKYRRANERLIRRELMRQAADKYGEFDLIPYTSVVDVEPHLAMCVGGVGVEVNGVVPVQREPILVRIHSQCLTGDIFDSMLCDCGSQLHSAMSQVAAAGKGCVLYMRQEGRGIGLLPKLQAYKLQQEEGVDTVEANQRGSDFAPDLRPSTASAPRFSSTSASATSACSRTIRGRSSAWKATASRSSSGCRSRCRPIRRTPAI